MELICNFNVSETFQINYTYKKSKIMNLFKIYNKKINYT